MSSSKRVKREQTRLTRTESRNRAATEVRLVESANALSANDFYEKYAPPDLMTELSKSLVDPPRLKFEFGDAAALLGAGDLLLRACLQLIEQTSAQDYQSSEMKWSTPKKWKEMKLPDMKYIVLLTPDDGVVGFVSFMVTYEDSHEVVYIYEIHLITSCQGLGLGRTMMNVVEGFAQNVGVTKVMLTVFRANQRAITWYTKLGYQEDEFSPGPRMMRNGTVIQPSYIILSKQSQR